MQSMTGYGRSEVRHAHLALTVEARSVNHRYLDIALRYPRIYAPLETRMKQRVSAYFTRGRIDITLAPQESTDTHRALLLDHTLAQHYYDALQRLQDSLGLPGTIDLSLIASLRDVFRVEEASADMENDWNIIAQGLDAALQALQTMRRQEGEVLSRDFHLRLQTMAQQSQSIRQRVPQVVVEYQQRLEQRVKELFAQFELDPNRVAQEAILFAERLILPRNSRVSKRICRRARISCRLRKQWGAKSSFWCRKCTAKSTLLAPKAMTRRLPTVWSS